MADDPLQTTQMLNWIDRLRAGDEAARDDLIRHACGRLERITRAMLKGYPTVKRWDETGDVLQGASLRLLRSLQSVRPASVRDFFSLGALQIRRELLDLGRHYYGPQGLGANHASWAGGNSTAAGPDRADSQGDPSRVAALNELHDKVDALPDNQRELVGLIFYQGMKQVEAAQILGVTVKTVQNHLKAIVAALHDELEAAWGEGDDT